MPASDLGTGFAVPGITEPHPNSQDMPSLVAAHQEQDEKKRLGKLCEIAKRWFDAHRWYYREAAECTAHYSGAQWGHWSQRLDKWVGSPESDTRGSLRITVNLIRPIVDQWTAMATREDPRFGAAAAGSEGTDSAAAETARHLIEYLWRQRRLRSLYRLTARSAAITGGSFVHVEWDATEGPDVQVGFELDQEPVYDPSGRMTTPPSFRARMDAQGEVRFTVYPPDHIAPDPSARGDQDGSGIFLRFRMSMAELRARFPDKFEMADADSGWGHDDPEFRSGERAQRASWMGSGSDGDDREDERSTVYVHYLRKMPGFPKGRYVIFNENHDFYTGDNPIYPDNPKELWPRAHWPIFLIPCDAREGCYFPMGRVRDMIPPQKEVNGAASKTLQHIALIANTKIKLPKNTDFEMTDEVGQVLRLARGVQDGQVGYLQPPPMPEYVQIIEWAQSKMEYIMGVNASSLGTLPGSDTSGRALDKLQQKDDSRIAPIKRDIDDAWGEIMRYAVQLYRRWATTERTILVVGENRATSVESFQSAQLAASVDVLVYNDQSLPSDPAQRQIWLDQFARTIQQVQDPNLKRLLVELWGLRDFSSFLEKLDPHTLKARRENLKLMGGGQVSAWDKDDHLVHMKTLQEWVLSDQYERRVEAEMSDPMYGGQSPTQFFTMQHYQEHEALYAQSMAAMAPPPAAAGAPPGEAPAPSMEPAAPAAA